MTRFALILLLSSEALAQVYPAAPRTAAMAAAAAVSGGVFADTNPAAPAETPGRLLALRAATLYGLSELRFVEAYVAIPALGGHGGFTVSSFGFDDFREILASVGYARRFHAGSTRWFQGGVRLRWYSLAIRGYGSASIPSVSAGALLPIWENLALGMAATNLYVPPGSLSSAVERAITLGIAHRPTRNLLLALDMWKAATSPADVRFGVELQPVSSLALRGGFTLDPRRYSAGAGVRFAKLVADLAAERHEALGWSPSVAVGLEW